MTTMIVVTIIRGLFGRSRGRKKKKKGKIIEIIKREKIKRKKKRKKRKRRISCIYRPLYISLYVQGYTRVEHMYVYHVLILAREKAAIAMRNGTSNDNYRAGGKTTFSVNLSFFLFLICRRSFV